MKRDEDIEPKLRRPPADEGDDSDLLIGTGSGAGRRWVRPSGQSGSRSGTFKPQSEPLPALKVPAAALNHRIPSYPAWEKPPSPYNYPRLRGREAQRSMPTLWPLLIAAIGVALVIGLLVVVPALTGHGNHAPLSNGSPSPSAVSSIEPLDSAAPSDSLAPSSSAPAASPTPAGPAASYRQYKVVAGDTLNRIATKFGVRAADILAVNPQITNANVLQVGKFINIPPVGGTTPQATPSAS